MAQTSHARVLVWSIIASHFAPPFMASGVAVALPALGADLNAGATSLSLVETLFLASQVAFLLPAGRLAGASDKATLFKLELAGFAVSSLVIGICSSMPILLALRFVQGASSAIFAATGPAILADVVAPGERGRAFGASIGEVYAGLTFGPVVAGVLTDLLGWRAVFGAGGILAMAMGFLVHAKLPSSWRRPPPGAVHLPSAGVLLAAAMCLVAGSATLREGLYGYVFVGAGLALSVGFVILQRRLPQPLVNIHLLMRNHLLANALFVQVVLYLNGFCVVFLLAIYMQVALGHPANVAGEIVAIGAILMTALAPVAGRLSDRYRPDLILIFGVACILISAVMGIPLSRQTRLLYVTAMLAIHGLGWALFSSPNMTMIMGSVPKEATSIAAALGATSRALGLLSGMLVTALLISLSLGNEPVDRHPAEFISIMTKTFWVLALATTGILALAIVAALRTRGSKSDAA